MEKPSLTESIAQTIRKSNKADDSFKTIKKLKQAAETLSSAEKMPIEKILSEKYSPTMFVFYFGAGLEKEYNSLKLTHALNKANIQLASGVPYGFMIWQDEETSVRFKENCSSFENVYYNSIKFDNGQRTVFYFPTQLVLENTQLARKLDIENCDTTNDNEPIPGLFVYQEFLTPEQEKALVSQIDSRKWTRLGNRKVQHYGFQFKYGKNAIDKEEHIQEMPDFIVPVLNKLADAKICPYKFDQLTINCYDPGDGIPSHFDTHSPFQEMFVSLSVLGDIVMEFESYRKDTKQILLRKRSLVIFSGEGTQLGDNLARFAWKHAITPRKMDKINTKIEYRSRRLSLTFRKIKYTPCTCPYYFYCDSQGYDQQTMKKNNPLLKKYLSMETHIDMNFPSIVEKDFVEKPYNGFGYTFSNPIHPKVLEFIRKIPKQSFVIDIGCGNGTYMDLIVKNGSYAFGIQKCTSMSNPNNPFQQRIWCDALKLPFKDCSFDYALVVAVWHHFASRSHRIDCLKQMGRILAQQAEAMITVWSYEDLQEIYQKQDILMDFTLPKHRNKQAQQKTAPSKELYKRYYHLFKRSEIKELFDEVKQLQLINISSQFDNYYIIVRKRV